MASPPPWAATRCDAIRVLAPFQHPDLRKRVAKERCFTREIGRIKQGFFKTQDRIVAALARLLVPPQSGLVTILDAGCGEGEALQTLRDTWQPQTQAAIKLYGIESDKGRAASAQARFAPSGGECLWSAIEDSDTSAGASLLYFNPPYDRIRQAGRSENLLFAAVKGWVMRGGHLLMLVPDYVLADRYAGLATAVERDFDCLAVFRYPEPEYQDFNQCILIARRRERAKPGHYTSHPAWAANPSGWPVLTDTPRKVASLMPAICDLKLRRAQLGTDQVLNAVAESPVRMSLLRQALAPVPKAERPLLPLKEGHLALALSGGHCDGPILDADGRPALIKGSLEVRKRKVATRGKYNAAGEKTAEIDVLRTMYTMKVRALRHDGAIEDYCSDEGEPVAQTIADTPDDEGEKE